ncbi:hypothetical protein [Rhodanobacter sp. PCA2]|nr:hypothetical protein [Rhodanobacter sp. PCA2]
MQMTGAAIFVVIPAKAGIQRLVSGLPGMKSNGTVVPASAGTTVKS